MPMRVMVAVPNDRRERMTRGPGIARAASTTMTATVAATARIEDRHEPSTTVTAAAAEVTAAKTTATEMATAKSAGADAGEAAAAETAAKAATEMTAAEAASIGRF
jgi:hypothetical protein